MASPTSRLLELLELLQARPLTTGREIADRLGIDPRTARRYIDVLQGLGIPVEGQRGVGVVTPDQMKRTRIGRSSNVSSP